MNPELWVRLKAIVAEVPFVDVLNTMCDADLPLTPPEWKEWGNPIEDAAAYRYIKSYSPYDNIEAKPYPNLMITAGLTAFYTTRAYMDRHPHVCAALTRAMHEAVDRAYERDGVSIAETIADRFPALSRASLSRAIDRYRRSKLWTRDPSFPVSDFARLKAALLSGGLISRDIAYETVVEDGFALDVRRGTGLD